MLTVHKYPVSCEDTFTLELPFNAKVLSADVQYGRPQMWVLVDINEVRKTRRTFRIAGTGHSILQPKDCLRFIDTFQLQLESGSLVFHLFEIEV